MNAAQNANFREVKIWEWFKKNKFHFLIWSLFIFWETIVVGLLLGYFGDISLYIAHYIVTISLFYFQSELLLPLAIKGNRLDFLRVPLALLLQLAIYLCLHLTADIILTFLKLIPYKLNYGFDNQFIPRNLYRGVFFLGFSTGYYFLKNYMREKKRTTELEKEQLNVIIHQKTTEKELFKSQNAFLKAQINPHFLFNTLNFIYNKVSVTSPEAAEAVLSLSDMMSYAITSDERGGMIKLEEEMKQTMNLIRLFELRKSESIYLKTDFTDHTKSLYFIPLVLLTLAENMFKHGQLDDPNHQATLKVHIENEILYLESYNRSRPQKSARSSTGLDNIRNRLNYAYGEEVSFEYSIDSDHFFKLKLGVPLEHLAAPEQ